MNQHQHITIDMFPPQPLSMSWLGSPCHAFTTDDPYTTGMCAIHGVGGPVALLQHLESAATVSRKTALCQRMSNYIDEASEQETPQHSVTGCQDVRRHRWESVLDVPGDSTTDLVSGVQQLTQLSIESQHGYR